jgi:hypothetical protein
MSYHHYSPTPLGGLRATEEATCDASKSEASVLYQVCAAPKPEHL